MGHPGVPKRFSATHIILCCAFVAFLSRPTGAGIAVDFLVFAFLALISLGCVAMIRAILPTNK